MEEPIRKEDILDVDGVVKGLNEIIPLLKEVSSVLNKDIKDSAIEAAAALNKLTVTTKENQESIKIISEAAENYNAKKRELSKLDRELLVVEQKIKDSWKDKAVELERLKKQLSENVAANKSLVAIENTAEGSIIRMRAKLAELTKEYNKLSPAVRNQAAPAIKKLSDELKKAESAIGDNRRNVGNYAGSLRGLVTGLKDAILKQGQFKDSTQGLRSRISEVVKTNGSFGTSILSAGKSLLGIIGIAGLATTALNGLKNAFAGMEAGTKFLSGAKEQFKTFFQNIVSGNFKYAFGNKLPKDMKALSDEWDKIRKGDRGDLKVIAALETEIAILRYKSADATETEANQLMYLNRALEKEDELIKYKIADKQEELDWVIKALKTRKDDTDLLNRQAQLEAEIMNIQGDRNLQLMTKYSTLKKKITDKEVKDSKGANEAYGNWVIAHEEWLAEEEIRIKGEREKANNDYWENIGKAAENAAEREWDLIEETEKKREKAEQKALEDKQAAVDQSFAIAVGSLSQIGDLYQIQKENELSAAGDNAAKREEIEKKYAKRQQALAIGQALVDGAATVVGIWRKWAPINIVLAQIFSAISVASTMAQVAIIKAQKFAKGGSGILFGPSHASGGINVGIGEAEGGEHIAVTSRGMTSKYGSKMLDAVSDSINQGKFFEVWANVNREMGVSDPYTKKMYDLMSRTPTVSTDTEGNTVKEYPNGQKYVIKRFWRN